MTKMAEACSFLPSSGLPNVCGNTGPGVDQAGGKSVRTSYECHPWFALRVRSGGEAVVDSALRNRSFPTFLPTFIECRPYSDRVKKQERALFPGYLFCRFDPNRRAPILGVPGVQRIVSSSGRPTAVDQQEIDNLQRLVSAGAPAVPWPFLQSGQKVRIEFGVFAGLEGLLVEAKSTKRLVLSISLLQRSVSVEIDRTWIKPI